MTENANFSSTFSDDDSFDTAAPAQHEPRVGSALDILAAAVKEEVRRPDLIKAVPSRPKIKLVIDTNIDGENFQLWQRRAMPKGKTGVLDMDQLKLCCVVLANQVKGVMVVHPTKGDTEVLGTDGSPMTFRHSEFREMLLGGKPMTSATQMVRDLFASDGNIITIAREVLEAAGFGDEIDEFDDSDPTLV